MAYKMSVGSLSIAIALTVVGEVAVQAQDHGDAGRGRTLASAMCAGCHGVGPSENSSHPLAPPFATIASVRGMSETALNVALLTPHQAMPNIMIEPQQRADIVAYIMTLRPR